MATLGKPNSTQGILNDVYDATNRLLKFAQGGYQSVTGFTQTISTAGTAEQMTAADSKCIFIQADVNNTDYVWIGASDVDKTTQNGIALASGQMHPFYVDNANRLYVDVNVSGEKVNGVIFN